MSEGLKDHKPTSKELQKQYVICKKCKVNIYVIESGTETERFDCKTCGAKDVSKYEDYFVSTK